VKASGKGKKKTNAKGVTKSSSKGTKTKKNGAKRSSKSATSKKSSAQKSKKSSAKSNKGKKALAKHNNKNKLSKGNKKKSAKGTKKNASKKKKPLRDRNNGWQKSIRQSNSTTSASCGVADVVAAIKKFIVATNNLNQNKRIKSFVLQSQQKYTKAPNTFQTAFNVLADATGSGASCNGGAPNTSVATVYNRLKNCSLSAANLCNVQLSAADNATVTSCAVSLASFITAFQACVTNGSCTCFQSLANISATCTNQTSILTPLTTQKNQCIGSNTTGSFGDCRQQQMATIGLATGCKCPAPLSATTPVATTKGPSTVTTKAAGRNVRNRDLFRFKNVNL